MDNKWFKISFNIKFNKISSTWCKKVPIWEFVEVDEYICLVLNNQINLGNNVIYNLLDYGNEFIEKITTQQQVARNYVSVIDAFVNEMIALRQNFNIFRECTKARCTS